mmetsp:Transcript_25141/g.52561  ORF Transcript_25141/g.52561 Transcript_25141/m.52561 type:complete len:255 (-) Transcript_25141:419-1183(-)
MRCNTIRVDCSGERAAVVVQIWPHTIQQSGQIYEFGMPAGASSCHFRLHVGIVSCRLTWLHARATSLWPPFTNQKPGKMLWPVAKPSEPACVLSIDAIMAQCLMDFLGATNCMRWGSSAVSPFTIFSASICREVQSSSRVISSFCCWAFVTASIASSYERKTGINCSSRMRVSPSDSIRRDRRSLKQENTGRAPLSQSISLSTHIFRAASKSLSPPTSRAVWSSFHWEYAAPKPTAARRRLSSGYFFCATSSCS